MDNIREVVALIRRQSELERRIVSGDGSAVAAENELVNMRRRFAARPQALIAALHAGNAARRSPDTVSILEIVRWIGVPN
jgi:hypothetical protein